MDCHWNFFRVRKIVKWFELKTQNPWKLLKQISYIRLEIADARYLKELDNSLSWTQERPSASEGFEVPFITQL